MKFTTSLNKNYEFRRLYNKGKSFVTPFLVVYVRKGRGSANRVGFTVSTKIGKAVKRNRIRRRLREIYRLDEDRIVRGTQMVVVARGRALEAEYGQLRQAFRRACGKLGVLLEESRHEEASSCPH